MTGAIGRRAECLKTGDCNGGLYANCWRGSARNGLVRLRNDQANRDRGGFQRSQLLDGYRQPRRLRTLPWIRSQLLEPGYSENGPNIGSGRALFVGFFGHGTSLTLAQRECVDEGGEFLRLP